MPIIEPNIPQTRADRDIQLWKEWKKATGYQKEQKASELLKQFAGAINTAVNAYRGAPVPQAVLQMEAKRLALEAFADYNESGMGLASFITTRVKQRLYRYVGQHQNVARLPENRIRQIGSLRDAENNLSSRYGREPTAHEIADYMSVPVRDVTTLQKQNRRDLLDSGFEGLEAYEHDAGYERVRMAYFSLSPEEKLLFDYSTGGHGKPKLKPGEIAKKLNLTSVRLSQLKERLARKLKPYLDP